MKTPQNKKPKLAKKLNVKNIYFKREDLHPYGSHKGRSIPKMINHYSKQDKRKFVISSSGNAALAAAKKVLDAEDEIKLKIFVGKKINTDKLTKIKELAQKSSQIELEQKQRPKQSAFQKNKESDWVYLRQSTDDIALKGYKILANELSKIEDLQAVFIPASSGTTAQGIFEGFKENKNNSKQIPEIHIVQTEYCHPIAEEFDQDFQDQDNRSIASAIVDKIAHRREKVIEAVKESSGSGWVLSDEKIKEAQNIVKKNTDLDISANSALSIGALQKAKNQDWSWKGSICCLVCGE
ncbi:MAG: PLP-dependent lyase/thiolase [Candidatus Magasanikbacteria bacterium]